MKNKEERRKKREKRNWWEFEGKKSKERQK